MTTPKLMTEIVPTPTTPLQSSLPQPTNTKCLGCGVQRKAEQTLEACEHCGCPVRS